MQLKLGDKLRELRRRNGRRQEDLAIALGVTAQAVSRWEAGGSYPDMELMPGIANYFGVTLDELFGNDGDREQKISELVAQVDSYGIPYRSDDTDIDRCLELLRRGLAQYPANERLLVKLAEILAEAGWRRQGERVEFDEESGYLRRDHEAHRRNRYWSEAAGICEALLQHGIDPENTMRAVKLLCQIERNCGNSEKAAEAARKLPALADCRENLLAEAADGGERGKRLGETLIALVGQLGNQIAYAVMNRAEHFDGDFAVRKLQGAIEMFDLICDDGNYGRLAGNLVPLRLYLSYLLWLRGRGEEAFAELDRALVCARQADETVRKGKARYTAPLLAQVEQTWERREHIPSAVSTLVEDFPWWSIPENPEAERAMKADPRWAEWEAKTRNSAI